MAFSSAPFPSDPIAQSNGKLTTSWIQWFTSLIDDVDAAPFRYSPVALRAQAAAKGITSIPAGTLAAGLYRVTVFARISQAATTSSSLQVSIGFTSNGLACSFTLPALTGNTVTTVQSESRMFYLDNASPITYSTAYASVGATGMQYWLDVVLEQVNA